MFVRYSARVEGYRTPRSQFGTRGTPLFTFKRRQSDRGQSIVEFALVLPILVFLMVGVVDLARIYTTMLSVESAAREAADYGSFGSQKWAPAPAYTTTETEMQRRACVAASDLTDYAGSLTTCTNPTFTYDLSMDKGASWTNYASTAASGSPCDVSTREPPCWVRANLTYQFHLLVPLNFEVFGVRYGIPNSLTFTRSSIYPMTDLSL
jgi:Flp pilus assembly protein TadG